MLSFASMKTKTGCLILECGNMLAAEVLLSTLSASVPLSESETCTERQGRWDCRRILILCWRFDRWIDSSVCIGMKLKELINRAQDQVPIGINLLSQVQALRRGHN